MFKHFVYFETELSDVYLNAMNVRNRSYLTVYDHVLRFAEETGADNNFRL